MFTQRRFQRVLIFILLPFLYFLGARFAVSFTVMPNGIAILWPPNSVLLTALLLLGIRDFPILALLAIGAEIVADLPHFRWYEGLSFGVGNVIESTLAFLLLTRWQFDKRFPTINDLLKFILAGLVMSALVGASIGATLYSYLRSDGTNYVELLRILWFGDALGLMIFTPLWLSLWPMTHFTPHQIAFRTADLPIGLASLAALALFILSRDGELLGVRIGPPLLLPFIIFVAVRFGVRWATVTTAGVALVIVVMMVQGDRPFGDLSDREAIIQAQEFILIMSLMALGSSALLSQLRHKQTELEAANRALSELNQTLEARVADRTAELEALNAELLRLTEIDFLTGIFNRRAFMAHAQQEIARSQRYGWPLAVMLLDIDHFKSINDHYGHQAGDRVLQQVAQIAGEAIRVTDILARYGGEEFAILMPETTLEGAEILANRILQALRSCEIPTEQGTVRVTASCGVTVWRGHHENLEQALKRADDALYAAKANGRDCAVISSPD